MKKKLNADQLGGLEGEVMRVLWDIDEGTVDDVLIPSPVLLIGWGAAVLFGSRGTD